MQRRTFLKSSALASTSWMIPQFLLGRDWVTESSRSGKILIIIQWSGGNDGLNTIIPFEDDAYYRARPRLGIAAKEVVKLGASQGLHPSLAPLQALYDQGNLAILNAVGYPNPNRSHFRSMDIWHTASGAEDYLRTGWIGRYLDQSCAGCDQAYHAIELDTSLSLAVKGESHTAFAMTDPKQLQRIAQDRYLKSLAHQQEHAHPEVDYLYQTMIDTQQSAAYLYQQSKVHRAKADYPGTPFGKRMKQIAELVSADTDTRIYYASLNGFDTHVNQKSAHARLLQQYAKALHALSEDLKAQNLWKDTLVLTFSEFGRRVQQNASGGTDHGAAGNTLIAGGALRKAGFLNTAPDLTDLDQGDLRYQIDFRQIYSTILNGWMGADAELVLGGRFEGLGFV